MSTQRKATPKSSSVRGVSASGTGWRVQKPKFKGATASRDVDRATFDTLGEAESWALACDQARREGASNPPPEGYRTGAFQQPSRKRFGDVAEDFLTGKESDLGSNDTFANYEGVWRLHVKPAFERMFVDEITDADVRAFRDKKAAAGYAKKTQDGMLRLIKLVLHRAALLRLCNVNAAAGITGVTPTNPMKRQPTEEAFALTLAQVRTISAAIAPAHRLAVWLLAVAALRLSEVFGLQLRHWDPLTRLLTVERQGGRNFRTGKDKVTRGKEKTKTPASNASIQLPEALAEFIDEYIERYHGRRPDDPIAAFAWDMRALCVGVRTREPNQETFRQNFNRARKVAGFSFEDCGYAVVPHFLRKTGLTWLDNHLGVSGHAVSRFARHKVSVPTDGKAKITGKYILPVPTELVVCADALQELILAEIGTLDVEGRQSADDYYTVGEAAAALSTSTTEIYMLLQKGRLWSLDRAAVRNVELPYAERIRYLIPKEAVLAEKHRREQEAAEEHLSVQQAVRLLGVPVAWIDEQLKDGAVAATKTESGHSWRLSPEAVDTLQELWEDHQRPLAGLIPLADAATQVGQSRRRVKQMIDEGTLAGEVPQGRRGVWVTESSLDDYLAGADRENHISAGTGRCLRDGDDPGMTLAEAAELAGVCRVRLGELLHAGDVEGVFEAGRWRVNRESVLANKRRRLLPRVVPTPEGMLNLAQVSEILRCSSSSVLRAAAAKSLHGEIRSQRWVFTEASVRELEATLATAVPMSRAASELGLNPATIGSLADRGKLTEVLSPAGGRRLGVTRESLDALLSRSGSNPLSTGQVASRLGITHREVRALAENGALAYEERSKKKWLYPEADVIRLEEHSLATVQSLAQQDRKNWLTIAEAAARLHLAPQQVSDAYKHGELRGRRRGGKVHIAEDAVLEALRSAQEEAP